MAKILAFMALVVVFTAILGGVMGWYDGKHEQQDLKNKPFDGQEWD